MDVNPSKVMLMCLSLNYTSNRAAAFLNLVKLNKALADAEMTITLKPDWEKVRSYLENYKQ